MPIRYFKGLFRFNYDFFRTKTGRVHCIQTRKMYLTSDFKYLALSNDSERFNAHFYRLKITQTVNDINNEALKNGG